MTRTNLIAALAAALFAVGCASTRAVPVAGPTEQPASSSAAAPLASRAGKPGEGKPLEPIIPKLSPRAQRLFDDAVAANEEQKKMKVPTDWDSLERKWGQVLTVEDVPEAHYNLGVIHERQRKYAQARKDYQRALQLKPTLKEAAENLAVMLENEGNPQAAVATYRDIVKKYPEDSSSRVRLADKYRESGQLDDAWKFAREALVRDPKAVGAYKVMMRVALARENLSMAKLLALRALKLDDRDAELYFFVGQVLLKEDDVPGAEQQFRKALIQRDDYLPARQELLRIAQKKQHWEGVEEQCTRILKYDPKNAGAYLNLGIAYRYMGKANQALLAYEQAEKLAGGKLPQIHLNRGLVYMKAKNLCPPALAEFQKYTQASGPSLPGDAPVYALQKECEQIVASNQKAEEMAKQMKADDERKKREEAEKKAQEGKPGAKPVAQDGKDAKGKGDDADPDAAPAPAPEAPKKSALQPAAAGSKETKPEPKPASGREPKPTESKPVAQPPAPAPAPSPNAPPDIDPDEPKG